MNQSHPNSDDFQHFSNQLLQFCLPLRCRRHPWLASHPSAPTRMTCASVMSSTFSRLSCIRSLDMRKQLFRRVNYPMNVMANDRWISPSPDKHNRFSRRIFVSPAEPPDTRPGNVFSAYFDLRSNNNNNISNSQRSFDTKARLLLSRRHHHESTLMSPRQGFTDRLRIEAPTE